MITYSICHKTKNIMLSFIINLHCRTNGVSGTADGAFRPRTISDLHFAGVLEYLNFYKITLFPPKANLSELQLEVLLWGECILAIL